MTDTNEGFGPEDDGPVLVGPDEPVIIGYGVVNGGVCIRFDDWKSANKYAADHHQKVLYLVSVADFIRTYREKL